LPAPNNPPLTGPHPGSHCPAFTHIARTTASCSAWYVGFTRIEANSRAISRKISLRGYSSSRRIAASQASLLPNLFAL